MRTTIFGTLVCAVFCLLSGVASGVLWTGGGDGSSWNDDANWGVAKPTSAEEAFFNNSGIVRSGWRLCRMTGSLSYTGDTIVHGTTVNLGDKRGLVFTGATSGLGNFEIQQYGRFYSAQAVNLASGKQFEIQDSGYLHVGAPTALSMGAITDA